MDHKGDIIEIDSSSDHISRNEDEAFVSCGLEFLINFVALLLLHLAMHTQYEVLRIEEC